MFALPLSPFLFVSLTGLVYPIPRLVLGLKWLCHVRFPSGLLGRQCTEYLIIATQQPSRRSAVFQVT